MTGMLLVSTRELLEEAEKHNIAIPAFNFCNLETLYPVLEVAKELRSPVILQAAFPEVEYFGGECIGGFVRKTLNLLGVRAALHLDHGKSFQEAVRCIRWGFTSVMFDGSLLPLHENMRITRQIVDVAHAVGISVEGELGKIGGAEESFVSEEENLTDPNVAAQFVKETGVDAIAIAIGNAHGFYKKDPHIDFERLRKVRELLGPFPIVLHGGTGIPEEQIKKGISLGIRKVNFSTIIRAQFIKTFRSYSLENPENFFLMEITRKAMQSVKDTVANLIELMGCARLY
jgi:fructose-bisphosphate aldolase class II